MSRMIKPRTLRFFLQKNRTFSSSASLPSSSSSSSPATTHVSWVRRFLKFGFFSALTGAAGGAAYATYAYSFEEVDIKTKGLRELTPYVGKDDASRLEKFQALLYSASMTVPAKSIELYLNLRRSIEEQVWGFAKLPDQHPMYQRAHVFTLVLDLDETLIYSDWKPERGWRTFKRPGVDAFLEHLGQMYEIVLYSDQPSSYVDPIVQRLNGKQCIQYALSRPATKYQNGQHYRDLSKLNRDPSRIIYVSGHALESTLQPENSVPVKAWKLEEDDTSLLDLIPFLEYVGTHRPEDIRTILESYKGCDIVSEFSRRNKEQKQGVQKQIPRLWRS